MKVIYEPISNSLIPMDNVGIALGNFDGLHIGHAALINTLIQECHSKGLTSVVYTFIKHPENILRKKLFTPQIITTKKKIELLHQFNVDYLYLAEFDEKFSRMSPDDFIKKVLVNTFKVKIVVIGYNYKFGVDGSGDVSLLQYYGNKYNFDVIVIPPVTIDSKVVSSTLIREQLAHGYVDEALKMLGRPYSIQGLVIKGRNMGKKLGYPTANIQPEKYLIVPRSGVYLTRTFVKGKLYNSITNIGKNPTFRLKKISVETHIFDFNENIYNDVVEVFFYKRIRNEKKFNSLDSLVEQISKDILTAKELFTFMN